MKATLTTRLTRHTMARLVSAVLAVSGAGLAIAQEAVVPANYGYVAVARQELEPVVAPLAIYPDALLAQTLVASTYPQDVTAAAQWLRDGGDPTFVDFQNWDVSVKGLVHYPEALYLLADNYDWTNQLGAAFLNQRNDVMAAVQAVRNRAWVNGYLASNKYQNVVMEQQTVQIIPANPEVIYVPVYQPQVILAPRPVYYSEPCITFGIGIQVGTWLNTDCDWFDANVYVGNWGSHRPWWNHHGDHDNWNNGRGSFAYADNRPGHFTQNNITNVRNVTNVNRVTTNVNTTRWERDTRRPAPQMEARATHRPVAPERSVATAVAATPRANPAVRDRLSAVSQNVARPAPAATAHTPRPVANPITRPEARPVSNRESVAAVRPTPAPVARPTAVAPKPSVTPTSPNVRPAPSASVRPTPVARPTPAPSTIERPANKPAQVSRPIAAPVARPTPAPIVRPNPAPTARPAAPAARPTPAPVVRPNPAPTARPAAPIARPTPAPVVRPTPAPTARPAAPVARPTPAPVVRPTPAPTARPTAPAARPTPAPAARPAPSREPAPAARPAPRPAPAPVAKPAPAPGTNSPDATPANPRHR